MDFDDRLFYILIGGFIGFVAGYVVRTLQDIRDEMNTLNREVRDPSLKGDVDDGFLRYPIFANTLLFIVLAMTAFAAFASQKAANDVEAAQAKIENVTQCNHDILTETILALNERTTYTRNQSDANVDLQKAQADMLRVLLREPPRPELEQDEAAQAYFQALVKFLETVDDAEITSESTDYPTVGDLQSCSEEEEAR